MSAHLFVLLISTTMQLTAAMGTPTVRRAQPGREAMSLCFPVAELCAEAICDASDRTEKAIMTSALERDLRQRVGGGGRTSEGAGMWIVEDDDDNVVGSVAIEVSALSPAALDAQRLRGNPLDADVRARPLLSSLAISPQYRRRGLAKKLCTAAEAAARECMLSPFENGHLASALLQSLP